MEAKEKLKDIKKTSKVEPQKAKKKNKVKLSDAETAREFLAQLIYDHQGDPKSINFYRNITYMVQTYISSTRMTIDHNEIKHLLNQKIKEIYIEVKGFYQRIHDSLDYPENPFLNSKISETLTTHKAELESRIKSIENSLYEVLINKGSDLKKEPFGSIEWKAKIILGIVNEVPLKFLEKIMIAAAERHKILSLEKK